MIVTCNTVTYPFAEQHCGKTYDDVTHSTICPHDELPQKRTLEELERIDDIRRKLTRGEITVNAAREALNLPPLDTDDAARMQDALDLPTLGESDSPATSRRRHPNGAAMMRP